VVPDYGAYQEMVRSDISQRRYVYEPEDVEDCCNALIRALKQPSPPMLYLEPHEVAFDLMAKKMIGEDDE
jgi:hypothetical protein